MTEAVSEVPETINVETEKDKTTTQDMEVNSEADGTENGSSMKREREEGTEPEKEEKGGEKKQKVEEEKEKAPVTVGPKSFGSSVEMFDYFYKLLHFWTPNLNLNKYEHLVLVDLLKKGHLEPEKKIGKGIQAFQVRFHPQYRSRCFFLIREDDSVDDFSFRKCVDHILPLPENMQVKHDVNKALGSGGKFGRGGGGHGRGRGGWRGRR